MEKLSSVHMVDLSVLRTDPPSLVIAAMGSSSSTGWSDAKLEPIPVDGLPADGIYEFNFVATPPVGVALQSMVPQFASLTLSPIPADLKGVRVNSSGNSQEAMLGSEFLDIPASMSIDFLKGLNVALLSSEASPEGGDGGILESMQEFADDVTDFVREHNIGGEYGRDVADDLDKKTKRSEREKSNSLP